MAHTIQRGFTMVLTVTNPVLTMNSQGFHPHKFWAKIPLKILIILDIMAHPPHRGFTMILRERLP